MIRLNSLDLDMFVTTFHRYGNCCIINSGHKIHDNIYWWRKRKDGYFILEFDDFIAIDYNGDMYLISRDDYGIIEDFGVDGGIRLLSI